MRARNDKETNLTLLDKVVGYFSPEAGLRRLAAREGIGNLNEFRYEAAQSSRLRGGAPSFLSSYEDRNQALR